MKLYKENFTKNTLQKVVNDMEKEKVLIIEQACREYNISPTDLVSFIHALGKISEEDAKKVIWMATGMALASGAEVNESSIST
jgi:hypothetical protein